MNFLGIGPLEILVILAVALIAFGPNRLPELARHVAKAMKMFREASNEIQKQLDMADWDKDVKSSKSSYDSSYAEDSPYGESSYDSKTSYASSDLENDSSSSETDSQTDEYSYPYGQEESEPEPEQSPAPKPEPIDDPDKTDDAQRYAREMTD